MIIPPDYTVILTKLLLAAFLGLLIGSERELHKKPAGLRTHSLVSLGACLFILVPLNLVGDQMDFIARVIPGIITGIGFLGAGMIFQAKDKVRGLTTAAEIWTLASIGILVGIGAYFIAIVATILILIILVPFKWFEKEMEK